MKYNPQVRSNDNYEKYHLLRCKLFYHADVKRMLLGNYYTFQQRQMKIERNDVSKQLLLYDEERDNKYPDICYHVLRHTITIV